MGLELLDFLIYNDGMLLTTIKINSENLIGWHFHLALEKQFQVLDKNLYHFAFGIFEFPKHPVIGLTIKSQIGKGFYFDFNFKLPFR